MTGPEHYREAERLLAYAKGQDNARDRGWMTRAQVTAEAQVHATLALAAAAATGLDDHPAVDWDAWRVSGASRVAPPKEASDAG